MQKIKKVLTIILSIFGAYFLIVYVGLFLLFPNQKPSQSNSRIIGFVEFLSAIKSNSIESIVVQGDEYKGRFRPNAHEGANFETVGPPLDKTSFDLLINSKTEVEYIKPREVPLWKVLLPIHAAVLFLGGCTGFILGRRRSQR